MEFRPERQGSVSPDFLSLVDQIMGIIRRTDQLLSDSLGYVIHFHSMLASMEISSFQFQVDMEIDFPQQLILGDPMTEKDLAPWFSQSHEALIEFLSNIINLESVLERWEEILNRFRCKESLLFRPVEAAGLEELKNAYSLLLEQGQSGLQFSMKKTS